MKYPVECIKINTRTPYILCKVKEAPAPVLELEKEEQSDYKRAFSVRLMEAVRNLPKSKKSIKNIEKPKRKRRRRNKKT